MDYETAEPRVALRHRTVTVFRCCRHSEEIELQAGLSDDVFCLALEREAEKLCRECSRKALAAVPRSPDAIRRDIAQLWPE